MEPSNAIAHLTSQNEMQGNWSKQLRKQKDTGDRQHCESRIEQLGDVRQRVKVNSRKKGGSGEELKLLASRVLRSWRSRRSPQEESHCGNSLPRSLWARLVQLSLNLRRAPMDARENLTFLSYTPAGLLPILLAKLTPSIHAADLCSTIHIQHSNYLKRRCEGHCWSRHRTVTYKRGW